ncbi:MAG: ABC transporter ATP-binding protein [Bacteroidales bacterium]|nr:ABC transporter ATP-binding protein [Bacteroidales bacterium]
MELATEHLTCGYTCRPVLTGITVSLRPGSLTAILGPNGAGKTTFLKTLSRLLPPLAGRVTLSQSDTALWSTRRLARNICYLPQIVSPDWPFTVREFISLSRAPHRGWWRPLNAHDQEIVDEAVRQLALSHLEHKPVTNLSGGEWQRVRLAQSLAQQSPWLLLDEPNAHLDPRATYELLVAIRALIQDRGLGVVMSLHDLNLVGPWADRVLLFGQGRLLADGTPGDVLVPDLLEAAYDLRLGVIPHPLTASPIVTITP